MKKVLSIALALSIAAGLLAFSAVAAAPDISKMSTEQVANLDISRASAETREAILAARSKIIYGDQAWTVDGAVSLVDADGTVKELPEFSDLFPGWDVPEMQLEPINPAYVNSASTSSWPIRKNVTLTVASSTVAAQKFASFTGDGNPVYVRAVTTPCDGARFNVGFTDDNGNDLGWIPSVTEDQQVKLETNSRIYYHVRASVSNAAYAGQYQLTVTDVKKIIWT